ncbi:hypothetical protein ASF28_02955 [Methylobacterium sp. Leaf99]|nr:hypothetical protein ASF28_02955 [Methylobacterium sp. Leaf99]
MQTTEFYVGDPPLVHIEGCCDTAVDFAVHQTKMNLYGLLKREAVAGRLVSSFGHYGLLLEALET